MSKIVKTISMWKNEGNSCLTITPQTRCELFRTDLAVIHREWCGGDYKTTQQQVQGFLDERTDEKSKRSVSAKRTLTERTTLSPSRCWKKRRRSLRVARNGLGRRTATKSPAGSLDTGASGVSGSPIRRWRHIMRHPDYGAIVQP
jgi:hypothetical protein